MAQKGTFTTADYLEFDMAVNVGNKLLKEDKTQKIGFYIIVAINTGLRIGDILELTWEQIKGDKIELAEEKTGKRRIVAVNEAIKTAIDKVNTNSTGLIFVSQKKSVYTRQQINRKLKDVFSKEAKHKNISSHSLRKTFGRRVFYNNNESERALIFLSDLLNHQNTMVTRRYLGIRQEELNNIYLTL